MRAPQRGSSWEDAHSEENTKREDLVSKPGRHFDREISRVNYERKQSEKEKAEAAGAAPPAATTAADLAHALAELRAEEAFCLADADAEQDSVARRAERGVAERRGELGIAPWRK